MRQVAVVSMSVRLALLGGLVVIGIGTGTSGMTDKLVPRTVGLT